MIITSLFATPEGYRRILAAKHCEVLIRPRSMASEVDDVAAHDPRIRKIDGPELEDLLGNKAAQINRFSGSWAENQDDPWLVFHTSGTTGTHMHRIW